MNHIGMQQNIAQQHQSDRRRDADAHRLVRRGRIGAAVRTVAPVRRPIRVATPGRLGPAIEAIEAVDLIDSADVTSHAA